MTVTDATTQAPPSWWSQKMGSGEADPTGSETGGATGGDDSSFGFADFVDVINPLQHIPIVGAIYRELTGDQISETARMAGGAIWGGPAGLIGALANTITEREAGGDIGATALAMARGEEVGPATADPATVVAATPATGEIALSDAALGFAAAQQIAPQAGHPMAQQTANREFTGSAANRLDAFIKRANAVRTPAEAPLQSRSPQLTAEAPRVAPTVIAPVNSAAVTSAGNTSEPTPTPLKLAADGNTDVAGWMMRALDRYESMKTREQT